MKNKTLPYQINGQVLHYVMPKEVDHHVAQGLCKELDMLVDAYQIEELLLDFKETEFMDSSGIGVVIGRSKMLGFRGGKVSVTHLSNRIDNIFKATGLYKVVSLKEV